MKELKFIHITKTAGTSIVEAGFRCGLLWGWRHSEYGWWHGCFPLKPLSFREMHDWFSVVRNPYDRLLSEFHCDFAINEEPDRSMRRRNRDAIERGDAKMFNEVIRHRIRSRNSKGSHYTEQFRYFEGLTSVRILRFESLFEDFRLLMDEYSLGVTLGESGIKAKKTFRLDDIDESTLRLANMVYMKDFWKFGYDMRKTKPILQ